MHDLTESVLALLEKAKAESREIVTLYYAEGVGEQEAEAMIDILTDAYPDLDYELV